MNTPDILQNFKTQVAQQMPQSATLPSGSSFSAPSIPQTTSSVQQPINQPGQPQVPHSSSIVPQPAQSNEDPTLQLHPNYTPSPANLQQMDFNTLNTVASLLSGENMPQTISVQDLNNYVAHLNQMDLGHPGDTKVQPAPKGFDPKVGYNGFLPGQCTSYASWYMNNVLGKPWTDTGNGNAKNWPALAKKQGYIVDSKPSIGSVVVWPNMGQYGHVAVVQGVNQDGTIDVSEFNYQPGKYSERSNTSIKGAVFIK